MSIKTSSIADALKNSTARRNVAPVEESYEDSKQETEYDYNNSDYNYDDERTVERNEEYNDYEESQESPNSFDRQPKNTRSKTARPDDLIGRLNRLSQERPGPAKTRSVRPPEDEETHRATSRQRHRARNELPRTAKMATNSQSFANDFNEWDDEPENTQHSNRHQSRARTFDNSSEDEYEQTTPIRTSRRTVRRTPEPQKKSSGSSARSYRTEPVEVKRPAPVLSRGRRPTVQAVPRKTQVQPEVHSYRTTKTTSAVTQPRRRQPVNEPELDEDYFEDHQPEERNERQSSTSATDLAPFNSLSKTSITAASKYAGVHSMEAAVYDPIKQLVGQFVYDVLDEASKNGGSEKLSSEQLEPAVQKVMGRNIDELEDLSQSFVNNKAFLRWLDSLTSSMGLTLMKEAVMFLEQCVDFYLVELLANARELVEQQRRSRLTVDHIQMASRMR